MRSHQHLLALLILFVAIVGCNRTYDPIPEYLDDIYPIVNGKERIYHVIDTNYSSSTGPYDARSFYKKEVTDGTEQDLLNREVSKLWLYTSPDTLDSGATYNWTYSELWTQYLDKTYAERIEGNRRILVLRIPPYIGSSWNGNLHNNGDVETYTYLNLDSTVTLRGKTYEHCVYVEQVPYRKAGIFGTIFYSEVHAYEIYAPKIGKIVQYRKSYIQQNGEPEADSRVYYEELVSHNY